MKFLKVCYQEGFVNKMYFININEIISFEYSSLGYINIKTEDLIIFGLFHGEFENYEFTYFLEDPKKYVYEITMESFDYRSQE